MDSLFIQFRDNERRHDDLHMWIEGYSRTMPSYYLAFDSALLAGDESADKVRRVLIRLLQRWGEALAQATPTRTVYLPFDFSDEYTGCSSVPTIRRLHRDCSRHFEPRGLETLAERSRRLLFWYHGLSPRCTGAGSPTERGVFATDSGVHRRYGVAVVHDT